MDVDLNELLQVQTVSVVSAVDAGKLIALLKDVLDKTRPSEPSADVQGAVDALRKENEALRGDVDDLKSQLVRLK